MVYPLLFAFAPFGTATGLLNTYQWYPLPLVLRTVHYALLWIITGSLILVPAVSVLRTGAFRLGRPLPGQGSSC